jgi:hypothetical protein
MLSSMSPTLLLDPQGRPFMSIGSPGATRIIPTLAQVISNVIDRGMPIQTAVNAPRLFQDRTGNLQLEGRYSINAYNGLVALGHRVTLYPDFEHIRWRPRVLFDHAASAARRRRPAPRRPAARLPGGAREAPMTAAAAVLAFAGAAGLRPTPSSPPSPRSPPSSTVGQSADIEMVRCC